MVDGLQRPGARLADLLRVPAKLDPARGRLPVLQARAQLAIATGQTFPQTQNMTGELLRATPSKPGDHQRPDRPRSSSSTSGITASISIGKSISGADSAGRSKTTGQPGRLGGRLRRHAGHAVGRRGHRLRANAHLPGTDRVTPGKTCSCSRETLTITEARFRGGTTSELDVYQARSTLEQTEAQIPELEISLRQTSNKLCILLGMPPEELWPGSGSGPFPRRRPKWPWAFPPTCCAVGPTSAARNVRRPPRAPRSAWPRPTSIRPSRSTARWAIRPQFFPDLFSSEALNGSVGPSFQWNMLNYGRILNNVRLQDARFQDWWPPTSRPF